MSANRQRWLVRLYPAAWRERYGDELAELLERESGPSVAFDIARAAAVEWVRDMAGVGVRTMPTYRSSVIAMARHPSAWVPLVLSGLALAELLTYLALFGAGSGRATNDEGTAAHLYQLMIGLQLLIVSWFALRWGWRDLKAGASVLALQVLAILASFGPLWLIEH